jgi:hypothetical protein
MESNLVIILYIVDGTWNDQLIIEGLFNDAGTSEEFMYS